MAEPMAHAATRPHSLAAHHEKASHLNRPGRTIATVGIVGPVFSIALTVVLGLLWEGYDPVRQTQSELDLFTFAGRGTSA